VFPPFQIPVMSASEIAVSLTVTTRLDAKLVEYQEQYYSVERYHKNTSVVVVGLNPNTEQYE
jgi:hypothetical protein